MVRWTRSARVASSGKFFEAIKWAKEIAEFDNKKYKVQVSVYMDSFGELGTIRWFIDFADLAALEKFMNRVMGDKEHRQKISPFADLFIQDSVYDTVMQSI